MEKYQKNNDHFEKYLDGSLSDDEKKAVEKLLADNAAYAKEFELYKLVVDGIKYSGRKKMQQKISEWEKEVNEGGEEKGFKIRPIGRYYMAASIAFFLVLSSILYLNRGIDYDDLYADYYSAYNYNSATTRGEDTKNLRISQLYDQAKYREVIAAMNDIPPESHTGALTMVLSCSYMELEEFEEAIIVLRDISQRKGSYETASTWYLSLCYLATGRPELSVPLLTELAGLNSSYSSGAKHLLEELE